MNLQFAIKEASIELKKNNIQSSQLDSEILMAEVIKKTREYTNSSKIAEIKNDTKGYVDAKRTSTFGTSKRFVRKFPSRSGSNGIRHRRPKSSTRVRKKKKKVLESLYKLKSTDKSSNSAVAGIIKAMKFEAKLWAEKYLLIFYTKKF